jgi:hypothetical protein
MKVIRSSATRSTERARSARILRQFEQFAYMRGAWKLKAFKWNARRLRGRDLSKPYLSTPYLPTLV